MKEPQHRTGVIDSEDVVPCGRDGLREDPAPAAEVDDKTFLEPSALEHLQEDGSGASRDLSETGVVDSGEVVPVGHPANICPIDFLRY